VIPMLMSVSFQWFSDGEPVALFSVSVVKELRTSMHFASQEFTESHEPTIRLESLRSLRRIAALF
jgi:hypothetical protein